MMIPGPQESEKSFYARQNSGEEPLSVFGITTHSLPVHYSNKKLAPWEAGCAWIEGSQVVLQLRKCFLKKDHYLGLVSKKELLEHETVHGLRQAFNEPRFEELLAYQTSPSRFRRFFGPFFRTARENALFFSLILLFPITLFFPYLQLPFIGVVAATLFLGFGRLFSAHRTLAKACKKLMPLVENPLALLIHLSDQEIKDVATCPDPRSYFLCQEGYRWQLIKERFIL